MGPEHFRTFFYMQEATARPVRTRHTKQIATHRRGIFLDVVGHSILGLADVYNLLPACVVQAKNVTDFQTLLQQLVKSAAMNNCYDWRSLLSPRVALHSHPLKAWFNWRRTPDVTCKNRGNDATGQVCQLEDDGCANLTRLFAF